MRKLKAVAVLAVIAMLATVMLAVGASASDKINYNDPEYWETQTEHPSTCYKHEGSSVHGVDNGDGSVTLNPYGDDWPGDHYELLIVKSGSVDNGFGPGNAKYDHPSAGVAYFGPLNAGGEQGAVSHWIVCKGETPSDTTTTSTPTTTSTTEQSTTTTTEQTTTTTSTPTTTTEPSTTTTVQETTTSSSTTTTEQSTTTTTSDSTTTTDPGSTTSTVPPTTTTTPPELPKTGAPLEVLALIGGLLLTLGSGVVFATRRH